MLNESLLKIRNLTIKSDRVNGLYNFSMNISPGEIHVILGEQNSGKSLITQSLFQQLPESDQIVAGEIFFKEKPLIGDASGVGDRITYMFSNPQRRFYPFYPLGIQIEDLLWHFRQRINRKTYFHILQEYMEMIGLPKKTLKLYPHEIGEEQQFQIFLLTALCSSPDLIVIDRTFSAMDISLRRRMLNVLMTVQRKQNIALLWVTHNLSLARIYAHRVTMIYQGRILEQGDAGLIFKAPAHPYTRDMIHAEDSILAGDESKLFFPGKHYRDLTLDAKGCKFYKRCNRHDYACVNQFKNDLVEINTDHWVNCLNRE